MAPPGIVIYGASKASASGADKGLFGALGGNLSAMGAAMESANLSKKRDAGLIKVRMRVAR